MKKEEDSSATRNLWAAIHHPISRALKEPPAPIIALICLPLVTIAIIQLFMHAETRTNLIAQETSIVARAVVIASSVQQFQGEEQYLIVKIPLIATSSTVALLVIITPATWTSIVRTSLIVLETLTVTFTTAARQEILTTINSLAFNLLVRVSTIARTLLSARQDSSRSGSLVNLLRKHSRAALTAVQVIM